MNLRGKFIVIDGPDGTGKSTQIDRLIQMLERDGVACTRAFDPGGTVVGDRIRHVLLGYDLADVDARCETLLFMASRAQLVAEVIRPALAEGRAVLCDRYVSATCAYQVAAGFPRDDVIPLARLAVGDTWPDLTIVLDVEPDVAGERTGRKRANRKRATRAGQLEMFNGATQDAMDIRPLSYHERVRQLFRDLPAIYPAPVVIVDAGQDPDAVFSAIESELRRVFS